MIIESCEMNTRKFLAKGNDQLCYVQVRNHQEDQVKAGLQK